MGIFAYHYLCMIQISNYKEKGAAVATPLENREVNQTEEQTVLKSRVTRSLYEVN